MHRQNPCMYVSELIVKKKKTYSQNIHIMAVISLWIYY